MNKKNFFSHAAIYFLFFINTVYSAMNGFTWPYGVTVALTAIMLAFDILEVIRRVRK